MNFDIRRAAARIGRSVWSLDPWLRVILVVAFLFCLYGIGWGRVECWNRDQMALRGLRWLRPSSFTKPPFHTYLNHLLILSPLHLVEFAWSLLTGVSINLNHARLLGSRLLVLALFLGTIVLGYAISLRFHGRFAARVVALLLGTTATFIAYAHFLSVDAPLLFWMLLALYFAQGIIYSPARSSYIWAGLITGLAAATKYNGIAVGIALPVAHLLSANWKNARGLFFDRNLIAGLLMVPAGFIAGNPYCVIDARRFAADFMYNYRVAPHYGGESGTGYFEFLRAFPEIFGVPGTIAISLLVVASLVVVLWLPKIADSGWRGFVLCGSVALLYYLKIGSFARMPTRFVLPAMPFVILMAGPFLQAASRPRGWLYVALAPLVAYNCICCVYVGKRFSDDPRLAAQSWLMANLPPATVIESSAGCPHWSKLPGLNLIELKPDHPDWPRVRGGQSADLRMPSVNGREELFGRILKDDPWVESGRIREGHPDEALFTPGALAKRNPAYVAAYSSDYKGPSDTVRTYYRELLDGHLGYDLAFDGKTPAVPTFVYPKEIDFLAGRITILKRSF